ncbi:MAG: hypothetical protein QM831_46140 [Kofleriaceae bacterium]
MSLMKILAVAVSLSLVGCATDDEPEVTAESQGLTQVGLAFSWTVAGGAVDPDDPPNDPPPGVLGSSDDRNCFLTSVTGNIQGQLHGQNYREAGGEVFIDKPSRTWQVRVARGYASSVSITGICIPGTTHRLPIGGEGGTTPGGFDPNTTANTHCFLDEMLGYGFGFWGTDDSIAVRPNLAPPNSNGVKNIEFFPWSELTSDGHWQVEGDAMCFDFTSSATTLKGSLSSPLGGPVAEKTITTQPGYQCGLTGIGGIFQAFNASVKLVPSSTSTPSPTSWKAIATPGTSLSWECIK